MKLRIALAVLLIAASGASPAVLTPIPSGNGAAVLGQTILAAVNLSTAQTGNGDSTNTLDRGNLRGSVLLKVTTTVGATPTVTINIQGSADGTSFFNVAYAASGTPETISVAAIVITSATTNYYILRPGHPWRFLKLAYSANTNVTTTADVSAAWQ